jgi:hypothetical protein
LFARGDAEPDEEVGLAGAGVATGSKSTWFVILAAAGSSPGRWL